MFLVRPAGNQTGELSSVPQDHYQRTCVEIVVTCCLKGGFGEKYLRNIRPKPNNQSYRFCFLTLSPKKMSKNRRSNIEKISNILEEAWL
jgi:hypothetical protein